MIEINLARQLPNTQMVSRESFPGYRWICAALCLGIGLFSLWWTQGKQQEFEYLLQQKQMQTQTLEKIQEISNGLEKAQKESEILDSTLKEVHGHELWKKQPMALLEGVNLSIDGLSLWLDHIQMLDQVVEVRGHSFAIQDIESYVESLENRQVIKSLPVVEILDQEDKDGDNVFTFVIRFVLERQVTA